MMKTILPPEVSVACSSCRSDAVKVFASEINIHFLEPENATKSILTFPKLLICLNCGLADFLLTGEDLQSLRETCSLSGLGKEKSRRQQARLT
jgi:hypothetical protein